LGENCLMLEILHAYDNNIKAVCEWYQVNVNGEFDRNGEFVWVNQVEVSPYFRNENVLKEFIKIIIDKCPKAKFGYFWRKDKYPNRKPRIYHKAQWLKLIGGI
jgi:hypothetical protein